MGPFSGDLMSPTSPSRLPRGRSWVLPGTFVAIVLIFGLVNVVGMYVGAVSQQERGSIVENAIVSVELVGRLARDIDRKRILLGEHILERRTEAMARIEQQMRAVDADFAAAARAYEPLTTYEGEAAAWATLKRHVEALRAPIEKVLALSRRNLDVEAQAAMQATEAPLESINRETDTLLRINRGEADRTNERLSSLQRQSAIVFAALTAAGVALALFLAVFVSRLIRRREEGMERLLSLLEERNRDLDAFAGRVAHDLRAPLSTINLAAAYLDEREPRQEKAQATLRRGVTRMEALIEDLLALSKIDAEPQGAACNPAAVAASVGEEATPRLAKEGGGLHMAVDPDRVRCSEGLLRQVLWNLVDNAVKYHRPDARPEIEVYGHVAGAMYELSVSDNGIGMSPDEARHAFEPFYRAKRAPDTQGTGLGLSIVKRVVEVTGGTVSIDSQVGRGTRFTVQVPREDPARRK
jgi:signal transduction histidine kinase